MTQPQTAHEPDIRKKALKRWTFHMHTGKLVSTRVKYDAQFWAEWRVQHVGTNWRGQRTESCCGVFELSHISYELHVPKGTPWERKLEAFENFLEDVSKQHSSIIVFLLPEQEEFRKLVVATDWQHVSQLYNPKTTNILQAYIKVFHKEPPKTKGEGRTFIVQNIN